VTLDWKPPVNVGEHEIVGYVIKYSTVDTDPTQFGTVEFDSELIYTPHTFIGSLQPYTFYVFAVAAKYENGEGPLSHFSEPVQTKTGLSRLYFSLITFILMQAVTVLNNQRLMIDTIRTFGQKLMAFWYCKLHHRKYDSFETKIKITKNKNINMPYCTRSA